MQPSLSRVHITVFSVLLSSAVGSILLPLLCVAALRPATATVVSPSSSESTPSTPQPVTAQKTVTASSQRVFIQDFSSMRTSLETQGWTWIDQSGPFVRYRKGSQALDVNCGTSSRHYMMCDVNQSS